MFKLSYNNRPTILQRPEIKGVCVRGCISNHNNIKHEIAHAHLEGDCKGWLCFHYKEGLSNKFVCLHELAHILTKQGHTAKWRETLLDLGGSLDEIVLPLEGGLKLVLPSYQKKLKNVRI